MLYLAMHRVQGTDLTSLPLGTDNTPPTHRQSVSAALSEKSLVLEGTCGGPNSFAIAMILVLLFEWSDPAYDRPRALALTCRPSEQQTCQRLADQAGGDLIRA